MKTIWKYVLEMKTEQIHEIPITDRGIIHVGIDPNGEIAVWSEVNTERYKDKCHFVMVGTGYELPDSEHNLKYIGSVVWYSVVFHIYVWIETT